jgi:aromatic-L-amino-acid/L-tryptophan decarboxylase
MLDWLAKAIGLPDYYLASSEGYGGGVLQATASEGTYVGLLAAKNKKLYQLKQNDPNMDEYNVKSRLVAYVSKEV